MTAAPTLEVRGLSKAFGGVRAVDGVDFAVSAGELLALIGPNGAGKTTCFNMLNGQLEADGGSVRFEGRELLDGEDRGHSAASFDPNQARRAPTMPCGNTSTSTRIVTPSTARQ